jgi:HK97 family phage major capsid protein
MKTIEALKARLVELQEIGKAVQAKADAENRDLTAQEQSDIDNTFAEFEQVEADIARRGKIAAQETRLGTSEGRVVPPVAAPANVATSGMRNTRLTTVEERARWGFRDMGEFCVSVKNAAVNPSQMDQRLIQNAALGTYGSEGVAADGGFAVPPEWRSAITEMVAGEDSFLSMTDQQAATGNNITFPVDETTAWQTSGGILSYWDSEAAAITQSKPSLKELSIKLHRLTALVPVTEELLEDASALGNYVAAKAGQKMAFKVNDAIINGTGVGQPLGILNAPCKVSVAKVASQTDATFHADNAVAMMARMPAQSFARSAWFINQDVVPQILKLGFAVTTAAGTAAGAGALYLPPNGLANSSPYGSLLGRPIVVTEACATLGTVGDVILADMSKYLTIVKAGGVKSDVSIHLWFDQNTTAFRFVMRMNGQPWLSAAIARKNGSNTLSHFVVLASRP